MGGRAHAQVLCRAKDVAAFEELGFGEQEYWKGLPEGVSFLVDEDANYGNSSSLRSLAGRGTSSSPNTMREATMTQAGL